MKTFYFALATLLTTFVLLLVGGTVNPTGSSLACPDWPLCYGSFFPEMKNGVQYEHTHRLVATLVGVMTCVLAVLLWRQRGKDRLLARLGWLAVVAVIVQGVLGGVTVLLRLPTAISVGHLALSMLYFTLLIYITVRSFRLAHEQDTPAAAGGDEAATKAARRAAGLAWAAVLVQVLLGALVRHTRAGHVCGHDPFFCGEGVLWPPLAPQQLHMLHRIVGVVVALAIIFTATVLLRGLRGRPWLRRTALALPWLAFAQVVIGGITVATGIALVPVTAHLGIGAALLAGFSLLYFALAPTTTTSATPASRDLAQPPPAFRLGPASSGARRTGLDTAAQGSIR